MARTLTGERLEKELLRLEAMKAYEKENKDCALICGSSTRQEEGRWRDRWLPGR